MVQIKGTAVLDTIRAVKKRAGDDGYGKIVSLLDDETKKVFLGEISPSSWYPLDAFTRFLEVETRESANGNEEVLIQGAEAVVERQLRGIYKVFVRLGSPEFVIKRIAAVHATYFTGASVEVHMPDPRRTMIKYGGFEKQHRIMGYVIIGFFRKALEISGAENVETYFATPIEEGKGYAELAITWS